MTEKINKQNELMRNKYSVLALSLGLLIVQSCILRPAPALINCNKTNKGGVWIELDTTHSTHLYNITHYKHGKKNGMHYSYRLSNPQGRNPGVMWIRAKGRYKNDKKVGLWVYYTTCGFYGNWVYYLGNKKMHDRRENDNSIHFLADCPCGE